jgi:two-component system NtrC family response regulator
MDMKKLLLIEDDQQISDFMTKLSCKLDYEVTVPQDFAEGFEILRSNMFDLAIVEAQPTEQTGLIGPWLDGDDEGEFSGRSCLPIIINQILAGSHIPEFIVVARGGFPAEAKFATDKGAIDYIQIPMRRNDNGDLVTDFSRFKERLSSGLIRASAISDRSHFDKLDLHGITGSGWHTRKALLALADAADNDFNVLITGETGTGKRLFAKKIHDNSSRKNQDLVFVDCSSFESSDIGANTLDELLMADRNNSTDKGTILFHEIGYLPVNIQGKLIAFLRKNWQEAANKNSVKKPKYRIISTTKENLTGLLKNGQFREDFYYELATSELRLPTLRERQEDIAAIADYYIGEICKNSQRSKPINMSQDFIVALKGYDWPGNISELINVLTVTISEASNVQVLSPAFLPKKILSQSAKAVFNNSIPMDEIAVEDVFTLMNQPGVSTQTPKNASGIITDPENNTVTDEKPGICFYKSGNFWKIGSREKPAPLKDLKGFDHIHFLLQCPNRLFTPIEVFHMRSSETSKGPFSDRYPELTEREDFDLTYEKLDSKTKKAIISRIDDLKEKIDVQNYEDPSEALNYKDEIKRLTRILNRKVERDPKSSHERARSNITRAISRALKEIHNQVPQLNKYLNKSTIQTGDKMCYRPLPGDQPTWILFQQENP